MLLKPFNRITLCYSYISDSTVFIPTNIHTVCPRAKRCFRRCHDLLNNNFRIDIRLYSIKSTANETVLNPDVNPPVIQI